MNNYSERALFQLIGDVDRRIKVTAAQKKRSAQKFGRSTFALLAPLLAAPCGRSAMCFLRGALGFGWLDPRLICLATTPSRSHHPLRLVALVETPLRG